MRDDEKLSSEADKVVLRKAASAVLPRAVAWRAKAGFRLPLREWLGQGRDDGLRPRLLDGALVGRGYIRADALRQFVDLAAPEHPSAYWYDLWAVVAAEEWLRGQADATG
jgi:Asparagine synthase